MKILSVDPGKARTGIAVSDPTGFLASPVCVISEGYAPKLAELVAQKAKELSVGRIVVGLPRNMDGSEGASAQDARALADMIHEKSGIETVMWDERCSTVCAHTYLNATDTRGKKRKAVIDAVAAVVILQDYLDSLKA